MIAKIQDRPFFDRAVRKAAGFPAWKLVSAGAASGILINYIFSQFLNPEHVDGMRFESWKEGLILGVFVAPLLETYLFQSLTLDIMRKKLKSGRPVAMLVSAFFFGVSHYYSLSYIIAAFLGGCILAFLYLVFEEKGRNPLLLTWSVHSLLNLFAFLANTFFFK